ncbi:MAG: radical SAM protein [Polyangiaceae bacterium]|nr:radical SAM protein [Polyangiaceae bacterium]
MNAPLARPRRLPLVERTAEPAHAPARAPVPVPVPPGARAWLGLVGEIGRGYLRALAPDAARRTPFAVSFLVTARCPLRCQHCFYHYATSSPETELTVDEYDALGQSLGPFPVALFCGGEPYLRPDLGELVLRVRRHAGAPLAATTTNGQLTDSIVTQTEAILRAEPRRPFTVGFSLDGPREVHDAIRGRGTFERALATYRECQRLARHYPCLSLTATTVVQALNHAAAAGFVRWAARELRPTAHAVLLARQSPRGGEGVKKVPLASYAAAQEAAVETMRAGSPWKRLRPDALYLEAVARHVTTTRATGRRSFHCLAGTHGALVDPVGQVQVCEQLAEQPGVGYLGNLREHGMDFGALWQSAEAARARALVNHHATCRDCTHETMGHATSLLFPPNRLLCGPRPGGAA